MRGAKNLSLRNLTQTINRYFSCRNLEGNRSQQERHATKGKIERMTGTCKNSIKKAELQGEPSLVECTIDHLNIISKKY